MRALLLSFVCLICSSCFTSEAVTQASVLRRLAIAPDGVWHDLEQLALDGNSEAISQLFSRRYLLDWISPGLGDIRYEEDYEDFHEQLTKLDKSLANYTREVRIFEESVVETLKQMRAKGVFASQAPRESIRHRDDKDRPRGPNTGELNVHYWPQGPGIGTFEEIRIRFVQEFEQWRIDGLTRDIFVNALQ